MIPKPRRTKSRQAIEDARKPQCERCGRPAYGEPHHIMSHNDNISREQLFAVVSEREGLAVEEIKQMIYDMKRGV